MDSHALQRQVRDLLEPTVERLGFELVAVEWVSDRSGPVLRLSIDGPAGVSIDDCGRVSHHVSPLLDEADPIATHYHLEVSSPGMERPVQRAADFQRFVGFRFKLRLVEGHPRRRFTGRLTACDGVEATLEVDGQEHRIALDTIERANLVLDLEEYQKLSERVQP